MSWCDEFQQGYEATVLCDNGSDKVFAEDKLDEAKSYCDTKVDCIGVVKHPNGVYTPRCGKIITNNAMEWLSKNDCVKGNKTP